LPQQVVRAADEHVETLVADGSHGRIADEPAPMLHPRRPASLGAELLLPELVVGPADEDVELLGP
jgi:hypothetical protein